LHIKKENVEMITIALNVFGRIGINVMRAIIADEQAK
jgi:hypothetical protein